MKPLNFYAPDISQQAEHLTEAAIALSKNGGYTFDGIDKSRNELKLAGVDLDKKFDSMVKKGVNVSLSAAFDPTQSIIGTNTFEISNELIQDISPENAIENSPYDLMLPFKTINAQNYQQEILGSNYGYADGGSTVNGAHNVVPLLESTSNQWVGFPIDETSYLEGTDLIALREIGTSNTESRGALQKLNYGRLNLLQRAGTGLEFNRIESLTKGSWTWFNSSMNANVIISSQIPAGNVSILTDHLGTYTVSTNTFVPNAGLTINPLIQLGQTLTTIKNIGWSIEKIVMDNISYAAIFSCSAVTSQTQYVTMNSDNDVMGVRRNLFRITTIPALQGVDIEVDNRAFKVDANRATRANTRPLMWGKTVTASSFRALIVVRPTGMSRIGNFGFFPNTYARTSQVAGGSKAINGFGGGIVLVEQDLSVSNILNQKIQMVAASNSASLISLPTGVFTFDFNVVIA